MRPSSSSTYKKLVKEAQRLDTIEQLRLLEELTAMIRGNIAANEKCSVLELQGLGKEVWQDVEAQGYVDRERSSWSG